MRRSRGIAAYGRCRDGSGRVLLARGSADAEAPGTWRLPGGGISHGEHPADAVVREFAEQTGLAVAITGLRDVVADVLARHGAARHTDRVIYDVAVRGGALRDAPPAGTDRVAWLTEAELAGLPLMPFTGELLGLRGAGVPPQADLPAVPEDAADPQEPEPVRLAVDPAVLGAGRDDAGRDDAGRDDAGRDDAGRDDAGQPSSASRPPTGQRFAAYGLVTDGSGRVLLTLIADGYPGAGHWHLPGGGTDHGEQPAAGFLRELTEEAGQTGRLTGLLGVSHRRSLALGPEGYPLDWHAVRVLYRAVVDAPTEARVTEAAGGSTARAAWFPVAQVLTLPLTEIAALALGEFATGEARAGELYS